MATAFTTPSSRLSFIWFVRSKPASGHACKLHSVRPAKSPRRIELLCQDFQADPFSRRSAGLEIRTRVQTGKGGHVNTKSIPIGNIHTTTCHFRRIKQRQSQPTMALTTALKLGLAFLLPLTTALKFEMQAHPGHESTQKERCIRNFVAKDQLVVVTATVSGSRGDGQTLNMHVSNSQASPSHRAAPNPLMYNVYLSVSLF